MNTDNDVKKRLAKIFANIVSLSVGSNLLRNIGMLNSVGWSSLIFIIIFAIILKTSGTTAITILGAFHTTNLLRNGGILGEYTDYSYDIRIFWLILFIVFPVAMTTVIIKLIKIKEKRKRSKFNMATNTNTKNKKTQNNTVRQRLIVENMDKTINKKEKNTKRVIGILLIGIAIGATLILIGMGV